MMTCKNCGARVDDLKPKTIRMGGVNVLPYILGREERNGQYVLCVKKCESCWDANSTDAEEFAALKYSL